MADQFIIEDARREQGKLRFAITGPTGSGKTFTALQLATRIGKKVCVIDTENHSASKYGSGKPFHFKTLVLKKPYSLERYIAAIQFVEKQGYDTLVIDSLTHAWAGAGGALEAVDDASKRSRTGNSYTAWRDVTPMHRLLIETILGTDMHVLATMRSKMDFVQEKDEKTGKTAIRKVGLAPVQRDDMAYEFDIVGDMDVDHVMVISKSRCFELADKVIRKPGAELADELISWLSDGDPVPTVLPGAAPPIPTDGDLPKNQVFEQPSEAPLPTEHGEPPVYWNKHVAAQVGFARGAVQKELRTKPDIGPEFVFNEDNTREYLKKRFGLHSHKQANKAQVDAMLAWMRECFNAGHVIEVEAS